MSMTAQVYSLNALATELGRDRRTISKALMHTAADGKTKDGGDGWFLKTAMRALEDRADGRRRERGDYVGNNPDLDALEDAAEAVDDLLAQMRAEPDIGKRRELLKNEGKAIGQYARVLDRVQSSHPEAMRMVEDPFIVQLIGNALGEALMLCKLTLAA